MASKASWFGFVARGRDKGAVAGCMSEEEFSQLLRRERLRSDRNGAPFCVLTATPSNAGERQTRKLARQIRNSVRLTDVVTLTLERNVQVFLPDTLPAGARRVIEKIRQTLGDSADVRFEIHAYPSKEVSDNCRDQHHKHNGKSSGKKATPHRGAGEVASMPLEELLVEPMPSWKRGLDVLGASAMLFVSLPMLIIAAVAIRLTSPGPIFFVQQRSGLGGKPFSMWKFRTMRVGADQEKAALRARSEQDGPAFKLTNDPRITPIGKLLRATSIDELPQLWNVLRGDMSLVGPRPLPVDEAEACRDWQRRRLDVTPGLTCIWQIEGRSRVSFDEWIRMDLRYIRSQSLATDVALMVRTLPAVLLRKGAK